MTNIRYEIIEKRELVPCPECGCDLREEIVWMGDKLSSNLDMIINHIYIKCPDCEGLIIFYTHWTIYAVEVKSP